MSVYVESEPGGDVFVIVRLRTSAYADLTSDGDNRHVADLNRDKLRGFLSSLWQRLGLRLGDLEAGMYAGAVDEHGFRARE